MKILVVGGVAGGATAIARLRRLDETAEIILFERGKYISFANCGLPYYVGGAIPERDALLVSTKESVENKYHVDIRVESEVLSINREQKTVRVHDKVADKVYEESYDKLLLSTGSHPFVPPVEGVDAPTVFSLWTIPDADRILAHVKAHQPKKAVVVGGGFIGLEMAENLVDLGIETTIVEMSNQVMPPLDKDMATLAENHLEFKGVKLMLEEGFAGVKDNGKTLLLQSGKELATDLIILSIGVRPNNELAKTAGLELAERGHIRVDEYMQTSDPAIYAIGDVIAVKEYVSGAETAIPLAGPANKQGREVAANMLSKGPSRYWGTMGTSVAKIFDVTVAGTGLNEKTLQRQGKVYQKDYFVSLVHPMSHAGYYPGAVPMTIKLIFGADRKVLGAQIVGYDGVDKRIDTIATTIHFHGTVDDLANLELAYAPPYSSAKDPVNFAGYMATNILDGLTDMVRYDELIKMPERYQLIDVREDDEVIAGMLPGAIHIPLTQLRQRLGELDSSKHYLTYCAVGVRGYISERILKAHGFKAANLLGAYRTVMDMEEGGQNDVVSTDQEKFEMPVTGTREGLAAVGECQILNVCGLSCPGPIVQVGKRMEKLNVGDILDVTATDPGFARDIAAWSKNTGNTLVSQDVQKGQFTARLRKGTDNASASTNACPAPAAKEKTMIIFDGDLDKAIAAFIIANGAAAMGNKVHMFFTFWGLSILRKENAPAVSKDFISKMFGAMLAKGSKKLGLSKMNFMGAGAGMMRSMMEKKGISSLEELIREALDAGVELTACQMTMDMMGLTKEELIDGVKIGGVATMLQDNDQSNMNLFI